MTPPKPLVADIEGVQEMLDQGNWYAEIDAERLPRILEAARSLAGVGDASMTAFNDVRQLFGNAAFVADDQAKTYCITDKEYKALLETIKSRAITANAGVDVGALTFEETYRGFGDFESEAYSRGVCVEDDDIEKFRLFFDYLASRNMLKMPKFENGRSKMYDGHSMNPLETTVYKALQSVGANVKVDGTPGEHGATKFLDFMLPDEDVYIEVCAYHTPRKVEQMSRAENIILIQGKKAVEYFAALFKTTDDAKG